MKFKHLDILKYFLYYQSYCIIGATSDQVTVIRTLPFLICVFTLAVSTTYGQEDSIASQPQGGMIQDDPSTVLSRIEVVNEFQHYDDGVFLNVTTVRNVLAIGKRFTTRLEIPIVYNSTSGTGYNQYGIGDISFRLLGYKFITRKKSALLMSLEFSGNTAQSPLLGSGKNILSPVIAYSRYFPGNKLIMSFVFQQYYSLSGDESRNDIRWTRFQTYCLKSLSKKVWMMALPELYLDHSNGELAMNFECYTYYKLSNPFAFWIKAGTGLFGDHTARYQWTAETGIRYLFRRKQ